MKDGKGAFTDRSSLKNETFPVKHVIPVIAIASYCILEDMPLVQFKNYIQLLVFSKFE